MSKLEGIQICNKKTHFLTKVISYFVKLLSKELASSVQTLLSCQIYLRKRSCVQSLSTPNEEGTLSATGLRHGLGEVVGLLEALKPISFEIKGPK